MVKSVLMGQRIRFVAARKFESFGSFALATVERIDRPQVDYKRSQISGGLARVNEKKLSCNF